MTAAAEIVPGTVIDNRYQIQKILGQGGFGRTYLASDNRRFGELCVLKEFAPLGSDEYVLQKARELFQREAKILHGLNHPQIPKFLAWFEDNGRLFIGQEYVNGSTYWSLLQERQQQGLTFSEAEVVLWLRDLLSVLGYIHDRKIIHRDISPDNIMLPDGKSLPVLIDFGVVKEAATQLIGVNSGSSLIQASVVVGKFGYAPYEQIRLGQCSTRTDLYALAVTAVVLLTGKHPSALIDRTTLEWRWQSMVQLDARLVAILDKLMAEKPQDRYPSTQAVLVDLQPLILMAATTIAGGIAQTVIGLANPGPANPRQASHAAIASSPDVTQPDITQPNLEQPQITQSYVAQPHALWQNLDNNTSTSEATEVRAMTGARGRETSVNSEAIASPEATAVVASQPIATSKTWGSRLFPSWRRVTVPLMALLLGGVVIAGASPYIAPLCQALDNCTSGQEFASRYRETLQQASTAIAAAEKATTVDALEQAIKQLDDALDQFDTQLDILSKDSDLFQQVTNSLKTYEAYSEALTERLKRETEAVTLLNQAEEAAKTATETAQGATLEAYEVARMQWEKALTTLDQVSDQVFVAEQVKARSQEYQTQLTQIDRLITTTQSDISTSPTAATPAPASVNPSRVNAASPAARSTPRTSPTPSRPVVRPSVRSSPRPSVRPSPRPSVRPSSAPRPASVSPQPASAATPAPRPVERKPPSVPAAIETPSLPPPLPPPPAPLVCPGSIC